MLTGKQPYEPMYNNHIHNQMNIDWFDKIQFKMSTESKRENSSKTWGSPHFNWMTKDRINLM